MSLISMVQISSLFAVVVFIVFQIPMPLWLRFPVIWIAPVIIFLVIWVLQGMGIATGFSHVRLN